MTTPTIVPNEQPTINNMPYKLAIIGEAPGRDEEIERRPFVGASGRFLSALLSNANILRAACMVGNICQIRPPSNDIEAFEFSGPEITAGLDVLGKELQSFTPHLCLLLGKTALRAACGRSDISNMRGSLFVSSDIASPFCGRKCLATYHPAYALRDYSVTPLIKFDLSRARKEAQSPELSLPDRKLHIDLSFVDIVSRLQTIRDSKSLISFDIEGWGTDGGVGMTCCSIATSPNEVFLIPFSYGPVSQWPENQEVVLWQELQKVLEDPEVPKVLQNCMYDQFVLAHRHNILIRGIVDDTMLLHWEKYSELEKNLGLQTSLYTQEPYYKSEGKSSDKHTFWTYCCKDSAVTYEIRIAIKNNIVGESANHYKFNLQCLKPMMYMQLRGTRLDVDRKQKHLLEAQAKWTEWQTKLNNMAGREINVKSPAQMKVFLYEDLKLPKMFKRSTGALSTDYESLLKLYVKEQNPALWACIQARSYRTRISDLEKLTTNPDGRIRCSYNIVGTTTGRLSSSSSASGSGTNLENVTKDIRDCFIADDGCWFFQCDLSGADGWTVAAHCAALGDSTMLDDYLAGIKPAKVLVLMRKHGSEISRLDRKALKMRCGEVDPDDWNYFASKCVQHGSNYGMAERTLQLLIFLNSEGAINLTQSEAKYLQALYFARYPGIHKWHQWVTEQLKTKGFLVAASGQKRLFFGRKDAHDTLKAALAHEPQANTTYATNLALHRMYYDGANRRNGSLLIEPLNQIHDALAGQFPTETKAQSASMIEGYFDNTLTVHGIQVKIPYEGGYGNSWGTCKEAL